MQLVISLRRGERNEPCVFCLESIAADSTLPLALTDRFEPVCRACCRILSPALLALMETAKEKPEDWPPAWRIM